MTTEKSEVFPKPPPGYRSATPEEELEILKRGTVISNAQNTIKRCSAEIRAATLETQQAKREIAQSQSVLQALQRKLGIEGVPGDLVNGPDGKLYVLADKAARDAAVKPAEVPTKPEEAKE